MKRYKPTFFAVALDVEAWFSFFPVTPWSKEFFTIWYSSC